MNDKLDTNEFVTPDGQPGVVSPKKKWAKTFDKPVGQQSRPQAQLATGQGKSIMAGKYKQVNTRLPPSWHDEMVQFRQEIGCSMEQLKRWMMGYSLQALRAGVRPQARATHSVDIDDLS